MNMHTQEPKAIDPTITPTIDTQHYLPSSGIADTLKAFAGDFAEEVAEIYPFPHVGFSTLPMERIHLLGLCLSLKKMDHLGRHQMMNARWSVVSKEILGYKAFGLKNILTKLPTTMVSQHHYIALASVLKNAKTQKLLWQSNTITTELIDILYELPVELHTKHVMKHVTQPSEAKLIAQIAKHSNVKSMANRLKNKSSRCDFYTELMDQLCRSLGKFPTAPAINDYRITAIEDADQLCKFADQMKNCLRASVAEGIDGKLAFYRFSNNCDVAIAVEPRIGGEYVIVEIQAYSNDPLPDSIRQRIVDIFAQHGIKDCSDEYLHWIDQIGHKLRNLGRYTGDEASSITETSDAAIQQIRQHREQVPV